MSQYHPEERVWPRLVPKGSVMVSMFVPGGSQVYGVLSNISEGGLQLVSGIPVEPGASVLLRIGFDPDQPFVIQGHVVWSRDESDAKHKASFLLGIKFDYDGEEQRSLVRAILADPKFGSPVLPDGQRRTAGLEGMMDELTDELEQLGDKLDDTDS